MTDDEDEKRTSKTGDKGERETEKKPTSSSSSSSINKTGINHGRRDLEELSKLASSGGSHVNASALDASVRAIRCEQEKNKGNEAFNAASYQEAVVYYSRSIDFLPNKISYNNRALTNLKLANWQRVIDDCDRVLVDYDAHDAKALYRRAYALAKLKRLDEALGDVHKCLQADPSDKKAQVIIDILQEDISLCSSFSN